MPSIRTIRSDVNRTFALALLVLVYAVNMIDRQIVAILAEPIRTEFGLTDGQLGLLTGFAFVFVYAVAGLPIAWAADRYRRKVILIASLAFWSAMTALSGLSRSFEQLTLARMGVGLGEAGCGPPSHSMIADMYAPDERARALGIYGLGIPLGTLFGLAFGGWIAVTFGWRMAFFIVGLPGIFLALILCFVLPEPRRGAADKVTEFGGSAAPIAKVVSHLTKCRTFVHIAIGGAIATAVGGAIVIWSAPFLIRFHAMGLAEAGLALGLIAGIPGALGMYLGGALADRFGKKDPRWRLRVVSIALTLACPFAVSAWLVTDKWAALALLAVPFCLCTFFYQATSFAQVQSVSPIHMRASAAAVLLLVMNLVGQGGGPLMVGLLSDWISQFDPANSLRWSLAVCSFAPLWAAFHYWRAAETLEADQHAALKG